MWTLFFLLFCSLSVGYAHYDHYPPHRPTIFQIAQDDPNLSILVSLLKRVGLDKPLNDKKESFTVWAPTNEAFEHFLQGTDASKIPDEIIRAILLYHVVPEARKTSSFKNDELIRTANKDDLFVRFNRYEKDHETVNGALIHPKNIKASNGYVNIINQVLVPPNKNIYEFISSRKDLTTLTRAIKIAGLEDFFKNNSLSLTLFAPTNEAFAKVKNIDKIVKNEELLRKILLYHVLASTFYAAGLKKGSYPTLLGSSIEVSREKGQIIINENTKVIKGDFNTFNGVVHIIDQVLIPPVESKNLYDLIEDNPEFSILAALIKKVGLKDALKTEELTLFAPTNKAFLKEFEDVDKIERIPNGILLNVLLYHVLPGAKKTSAFDNNQLLETLSGKDLRFNRYTHTKYHFAKWDYAIESVNGIEIDPKNIPASNGFLNVIHEILIPPSKTIWEEIESEREFSILQDAVVKAGLVDVLNDTSFALTLFAPTNEAFLKLNDALKGKLLELLKDKSTLLTILTYHVLDDVFYSVGLKDGKYKTLEGSKIYVDDRRGYIIINGYSRVVKEDINTLNGVIHAINRVLIPPLGKHYPRYWW